MRTRRLASSGVSGRGEGCLGGQAVQGVGDTQGRSWEHLEAGKPVSHSAARGAGSQLPPLGQGWRSLGPQTREHPLPACQTAPPAPGPQMPPRDVLTSSSRGPPSLIYATLTFSPDVAACTAQPSTVQSLHQEIKIMQTELRTERATSSIPVCSSKVGLCLSGEAQTQPKRCSSALSAKEPHLGTRGKCRPWGPTLPAGSASSSLPGSRLG